VQAIESRIALWFVPLLLAIALQFASSGCSSAAENRVALLIGNSNYKNAPQLTTPVNDAEDIAAALGRIGFDTIVKRDTTAEELRRALAEFSEKSAKADIAIFYYAGYSANIGVDGYLIPVEARLATPSAFRTEAVPLREATLDVARARSLGLVIFDALRGNPFPAKLTRQDRLATSSGTGTRRPDEFRNVLVFFSTEPSRMSEEGEGRNSPMAAALLKYLPEANLEINFLFRSVRDDVRQATRQKQTPYMYGQVSKEKIFLNAAGHIAAAAPQDDPSKTNRCDELAASPQEAKGNLGKGVRMEDIDAAAAQAACTEAVSRFPGTDRFYYQMGRALFAAKDYSAAIESYKKAFELGNTRALHALGAMYDNGEGVPKDAARARFYYELAADKKFAPAIVSLAVQQERGLGVAPDAAKAYNLYQKAAELGDSRAINRMAALIENGQSVTKDPKKARALYEKSAAMGNTEAMVNLARCYANGIGGRKDIGEAKRLLGKAAQAGNAEAKRILADVENAKRK